MRADYDADGFAPELDDLNDPKLLGLLKAKEVWHQSAMGNSKERLALALTLHPHGMFSLNQIAKISRLSVPTVSRHMKKNAEGGRFDPKVLKHMVYLRKLVIIKGYIPSSLIHTMVDTGTSVSMIARVTGASQTALYLKTDNQ